MHLYIYKHTVKIMLSKSDPTSLFSRKTDLFSRNIENIKIERYLERKDHDSLLFGKDQ
jgi:hypothetical protein